MIPSLTNSEQLTMTLSQIRRYEKKYTKLQKNNKYYIGSTNNIEKRLSMHNLGLGSVFTKNYRPWKLICYKICKSIAIARVEEKLVKSYKSGNAFKRIICGEVAPPLAE